MGTAVGFLESIFSFFGSLFGSPGKDRHAPEQPRHKPLPRGDLRKTPKQTKPKGKPVSPTRAPQPSDLIPATAAADAATQPAAASPPEPQPPHFLETLVPLSRTPITLEDYQAAAARLGCSDAVIEAVAIVESGKYSQWDKHGRPTVLFEPHLFSRHSGKKHEGAHVEGRPELVLSDAGWYSKIKAKLVRYPSNLDDRWLQIRAAFSLNPQAALSAVSWGRFQVLGENWKALGYKDIRAFVEKMSQSEAGMLQVFEQFILYKKLGPALRATPPDWRKIALGYNGSANVDVYSDLLRKKHAELVGRNATAPVA